jgi:hypothetical protein
MTRHIVRSFVLFTAIIVVSAPSSRARIDPAPLTAHEWGTFTSIAAEDGGAVEWLPLSGPQDLPCFVDRIRYRSKGNLYGTVRMETPVVYLYAAEDMTVNVGVRFRQGVVTEWFPQARVTPAIVEAAAFRNPDFESSIQWKQVKVVPRAVPVFPTENAGSHYYAARLTDASPIESGEDKEKFLFYRGVGRFTPPISATIAANGFIDVRNRLGEALGDVILFENRSGRLGYRIGHARGSRISMAPPLLEQEDLTALRRELESILVARGLYAKEASAMLETWRDSWFEEGTRLFYIASRGVVDSILPLDIRPIPAQVARVFVGRMEIMTPRTIEAVRQAVMTGDRATFRTYGRFVEPIGARLLSASLPGERAVFEEKLKGAYTSYYASAPPTVLCQ